MLTKTEKSRRPTEVESVSTTSVKEQLLHNFKRSREYRHAFVEERVRTILAAQIKAIREQRQLSQPKLAEAMGKTQSWVSRLEDPNQPPPTIPSLLKAAETFDVNLDIRFGRFSDLLNRLESTKPESFEVPSFEEELELAATRMPRDWPLGDLGTTTTTTGKGVAQALSELQENVRYVKAKGEPRHGIEARATPIRHTMRQGATGDFAPRAYANLEDSSAEEMSARIPRQVQISSAAAAHATAPHEIWKS